MAPHHPSLGALRVHPNPALLEIEVIASEPDELARAQAMAVGNADHRGITSPEAPLAGRGHQSIEFALGEEVTLATRVGVHDPFSPGMAKLTVSIFRILMDIWRAFRPTLDSSSLRAGLRGGVLKAEDFDLLRLIFVST